MQILKKYFFLNNLVVTKNKKKSQMSADLSIINNYVITGKYTEKGSSYILMIKDTRRKI